MAPIIINGNAIDPEGEHNALFKHMTKSEWIIVECSTNMSHCTFKELEAHNIHIEERIGRSSYRCRYPPRDFINIKLDFIRRVVPYHPVWKIRSNLKYVLEREQCDSTGTEARKKWHIGIALHKKSQASLDDVQALIRELNGPEIVATDTGRIIHIRSELRYLEAIAEHESICSIEDMPRIVPYG